MIGIARLAAAASLASTALLGLTALPALVRAQLRAPATSIADDGYFEGIAKVAQGVWLIRQGEPFHLQPIGNVTVIEQSRGLVLVDSGGSPGSGRRIAKLVQSVSKKPVTHVIITHWHGDHSLGLPGLLESWPKARVLSSAPARAAMLGSSMERYAKDKPDPSKTAAFLDSLAGIETFLDDSLKNPKLTPSERAGFERTKRMLPVYRADVEGMYIPSRIEGFADRLLLPDVQVPIELFQPGPANTDGDSAVWLPRQRVLVTGDIVVMPIPFGYGSYPSSWIKTLQLLRKRPFATLIPGHGPPQTDRKYIDQLIALLEEVRTKVAPLARTEMSLAAARKKLDFAHQRRRFSGGDPWLATWFEQHWIGPIVDSAWKEAKGEPIEQGKG